MRRAPWPDVPHEQLARRGPGMMTAELALVDELADSIDVARPTGRLRRESWVEGGFATSALRWGADRSEVVFLHGGSMNAHAWDSLLLQTPLNALALDLPGHGDTDWFEEPVYVPEDLAQAVVPAMQALAPSARTVVGHSLGGLTALALAAQRPDLVDRLVLVDSSPAARRDDSEALRAMVSRSDFSSFEELLTHVLDPARGDSRPLRRKLLLNARELPDGRWSWRHDARESTKGDKWEAVFTAVPRGWEHAAAVRCPTLLLRGERSTVLSEEDVERYVELMPDLRVEVLPGVGHHLQGERPLALGALIAEFAAH
jgi:pimeloyl-ACP methyl ester carboxylesterase